MFSERGFSMIETLVGGLVGVALVVSVGVLGGNLVRHRANADSSSAAVSLAQQVLEQVRADANRNPSATQCSPCGANTLPPACPRLCAGVVHGPFSVTESGARPVGAPFQVSWEVFDDEPNVLPDVDSKRVVVRVAHTHNRVVDTVLETYVQASEVSGS